jgi:hypothetical protein
LRWYHYSERSRSPQKVTHTSWAVIKEARSLPGHNQLPMPGRILVLLL